MKPLLRPGTTVVRRSPRTLQVGTIPGACTILADRPGVVPLLRAADGTRDLVTLAALVHEPAAQISALVDSLTAAGVLVDATAWDDLSGSALVDEARALAVTGSSGDQIAARMRSRAAATVEISYDPATEALAAQTCRMLTEAGVRAVLGAVDDPTLVLVVSSAPGPRDAFDVLTGAGIAHLPVVREGAHARIGPLVRPGLTPCVRCDDVDRASYDPAWPVILQQTAHPIAAAPALHPHAQDSLSRYAVAARVAEIVLAFCDGLPTAADGTVTVLGGTRPLGPPTPVALQPDCACQILASDAARDARVRVERGVRMTA